MKQKTIPRLLLACTVILLAACAGAQTESSEKHEPVHYTIQMTEFAFQPAELQVKVGQEVTIELANLGALEHELMIGREMMKDGSRPDGYRQDMFAEAHAEPVVVGGKEEGTGTSGHGSAHSGFMVTLPAGSENASITFTATEDMLGEWEIGCFSQEGVHYEAGMKGKLVVSEGS
jgi:plastocyanin